jgi:hypothetical protein
MRDYRDMVMRTANWELSTREQFVCAALGLCGEAAEFSEHIKKWAFQGHELDRAKLVRELGDIRWYMELACVLLGTGVGEVEHVNTKKLEARYPAGAFSTGASVDRPDEALIPVAAPPAGQADPTRATGLPVAPVSSLTGFGPPVTSTGGG